MEIEYIYYFADYYRTINASAMKQEFLYKFGLSLPLGIFALWEVYYSYWWFAIHKTIRRNGNTE